MTIEYINIGSTPNDKNGDPLRTAFAKVNNNFAILESSSTPGGPDGAVQFRGTANLNSITQLNGLTVVAGYPHRVFTSTDLSIWTEGTSPSDATFTSITHDGSQFIAVGEAGTIATSWSGDFWTLQTTGVTTGLRGIAYGAGVYVAVGENGQILRSPDTLSWTVETSPTSDDLNAVIYSDYHAAFIAVGDGGKIITSADGIVWGEMVSGITENLNSLATHLGMVLIAGNTGRILASLDLFNWDVRTSGTIENLLGITVATLGGTATAAAVGELGTVVTASDSGFITWNDTDYTSPTTATLVAAATIISNTSQSIAIIGVGGTISITTGGGWVDSGVPAGLQGSEQFVFDAQSSTLNIDASIIPGTSNTWDLGSDSNRWQDAYFSSNVTVGGVRLQADSTTFRPLVSNGSLADIDANSITSSSISATTASFDTLTTNTFDVDTFTANTITVDDIVTETVNANTITANSFSGDGANLTGLPVESIIAGTNVTVTHVGGQWTINSTGGGGNGTSNPSHPPIHSVQLADVDGGFTSSTDLIFDTANSQLLLNGSITANTFTGNVIAQSVTTVNSTVTGNLVAQNASLLGTVNIDTTTANSANLGNIRIWRSNIYEFGPGTNTFTISSRVANILIASANSETIGASAATIDIRGGNALGNALGGTVTVEAGRGGEQGKGADLNLFGGRGGNTGGDGGNVNIIGGNAGSGATGGSINIIGGTTSGDPVAAFGSNIYIQPGNTVNEDAGTLILQGANASGASLTGGNIRITAGTGSSRNGNIFIGNIRWPINTGSNNQILTSDGTGNAAWAPINANTPISLTVSNIVNGLSNVSIDTFSGNVTVGVDGSPNVLTITDSTVLANSFTSNNFILGDESTTACVTKWVKVTTSTTTPDQVLFQMPAAGQNSVDFKVIAVDIPLQNKQSSMITTVTYGTNTSYSEYARSVINTVISDLSVDQNNGNIRLLASPRVAYLIRYTVIVSIY